MKDTLSFEFVCTPSGILVMAWSPDLRGTEKYHVFPLGSRFQVDIEPSKYHIKPDPPDPDWETHLLRK